MLRNVKTYEAGEDLTGKLHHALVINGASANGNVPKVEVAGANAVAIGFAQDEKVAGGNLGVAVTGSCFAIAGGTIAVGAELATDSAGLLVTATAGQNVVAICEEAGVVNQRIKIQIEKKLKFGVA